MFIFNSKKFKSISKFNLMNFNLSKIIYTRSHKKFQPWPEHYDLSSYSTQRLNTTRPQIEFLDTSLNFTAAAAL